MYYKQELYYDEVRGEWADTMRAMTPAEANPLLTDATVDFKSTPFFGWFDDRSICTNVFLAESAVSRDLQSQLLADAIPAESLPAGLAEVPKWANDSTSLNLNMAVDCKDMTRKEIVFPGGKNGQWGHSFFLSAPYMVVHGLFESIVEQTSIGGNSE